jgi:hypothetical protein
MGEIIKDSIAKWALDIYRRMPIYGKIIIILALALLLFFLTRNGIFGSHVQALSERIIPVRINWIDPPRPLIQLELSIDVKTNQTQDWKRVMLDGSYRSDSRMMMSYGAKQPCWLLIMGVDNKKVYPILYEALGNDNFGSVFFKPTGRSGQLPFKLDGTVGTEAYIAIASYEKFDFNHQIKAALDAALKIETTRGPEFRYFLDLDKGFYQRSVYFNTLNTE